MNDTEVTLPIDQREIKKLLILGCYAYGHLPPHMSPIAKQISKDTDRKVELPAWTVHARRK